LFCIKHSEVVAMLVPGDAHKAQYQALYSLGLLILLVGTCVTADLLARSRALEIWLTAQQYNIAKKTDRLFSYNGNFIDFEERILLDEIPKANYSLGGVFFFGTSNMKWAFQTWDLPADERRLVGNYGIGASNHTIQLRLIQYLIEQRKFLAAGERTLVIFGVSAHLGHVDSLGDSFFDSVLRRQGLFTITPGGQIKPAQISSLERWLLVEKARSGGLFWNVGSLLKGWAEILEGRIHYPSRDLARYREFMGPDWQQNIDSQLEEFKKTILLVQSHRAEVKVMLLPQGSWMSELPFQSYYEAKVRALCEATSTPLIDLSGSIPDEDFVDTNHLTIRGQEKFRALIADEINQHLMKIKSMNGESPADPLSRPN
jgi:hypothetical protein